MEPSSPFPKTGKRGRGHPVCKLPPGDYRPPSWARGKDTTSSPTHQTTAPQWRTPSTVLGPSELMTNSNNSLEDLGVRIRSLRKIGFSGSPKKTGKEIRRGGHQEIFF